VRNYLVLEILSRDSAQVPFEAKISNHFNYAIAFENVQLGNIVRWNRDVDLDEQVIGWTLLISCALFSF
jgi:hypothetical protein